MGLMLREEGASSCRLKMKGKGGRGAAPLVFSGFGSMKGE